MIKSQLSPVSWNNTSPMTEAWRSRFISWGSLPQDYRQSTKNLWLGYGLAEKRQELAKHHDVV